MTHGWGMIETGALRIKCETPTLYLPHMSSWEDHEEMIDDQYLMESIEEDQKLDTGASKGGEDDELEDE
jgi:hypothetical protein